MKSGFGRLPVRHLGDISGLLQPTCVLPDRVTLDNPAIDVMTDFRRVTAYIATPYDPIVAAEERMQRRKVRLLFVMDESDHLVGLITSTDLKSEKPMQIVHSRGIRRDEILVGDIMTPAAALEAVAFEDVASARVGHVLETLKASGRQHALVVESVNGKPVVRGLLSLSRLSRQLGVNLVTAEVAQTFAEIEAQLAHA